jgi:SRSO17 transposase
MSTTRRRPAAVREAAALETTAWEVELDRWLAPFVDALGDARRQPWLPVYGRGLLSRSERKSLSPLAEHVAAQMPATTPHRPRYHHLQQFITYSPWDPEPLRRILAQRADAMLGGPAAVLIVDDTALRKQGQHSVGVAQQYCGDVGKLANCQCLVSLTLALGDVPLPLALRLYRPAEWTDDPERCDAAGIPLAARGHRTKIVLALHEIAWARAAGVRFGLVAADAAYGTSAEFRQGVAAMGYRYAVGVQSHARVDPVDAIIVYPTRPTRARQAPPRQYTRPRRVAEAPADPTTYPIGRLRVRPVASEPSHTVAALLRGAHWQTVRWRDGTKGPLQGQWTAVRGRVADGEEGAQREHMPGEIVWLVGEQQPDGKRRYYFTNHPARWSLRKLVAAIRSRWVCEQAHLQLKQELGLDHFEGRSWRGLEHHTLLTMLSFAFLQHVRLQTRRRQKKN